MTRRLQWTVDTIGPSIRAEREAAGRTLQSLAEAIGISKSHMSLIESGQRSVNADRVRRIESALDIDDGRLLDVLLWNQTPEGVRRDVEALQRRDDESRALAAKLRAIAQQKRAGKTGQAVLDDLLKSGELRRWVEGHRDNLDGPMPPGARIPVINRVAAGYPQEFTDLDYPASIADEYITVPGVVDSNAFACRVIGDSMAPEYREGEIVVFSPSSPTPSGSDCFVRFDRDAETTFKRIYFEENDPHLRLQPINPAYPPQTVRREEVAGLYRAVYVVRRVQTD